jgi:prepilin-type processing-associated H-X9-DG protein
VKYKSAITKADFVVTLVCVILAFLNLGGLSSMGRERARRMVCAVNMARLAQANHIYANNWDEQFCPPMMEDRLAPRTPTDERRKNWLTNKDFQKYMGLDERQIITGLVLPKEYQCPTNILFKKNPEYGYGVLVSYAYNVADWDGNPKLDLQFGCYWQTCCNCTSNDNPTWQIGHKRTAIKRASEKINFIDSCDWWGTWYAADYEDAWDVCGQIPARSITGPNYQDEGFFGPTLYRHNEGANFSFYDGHVEWLPKEKAFIDTGNGTPPERDATGMWYVFETW